MIVLFRHGKTALNEQPERIRSWADVPLDENGLDEVRRGAEKLRRLGKVDRIYSSDLIRALDTAEIISEATGASVIPTNRLRDWNQGSFIGKNVADVIDTLNKYMVDKPDEPVDGGESFMQFARRFMPFLEYQVKRNVPDSITVLVTHNRNIRVAIAWAQAGMKDDLSIDVAPLAKHANPVKPGGFMKFGVKR